MAKFSDHLPSSGSVVYQALPVAELPKESLIVEVDPVQPKIRFKRLKKFFRIGK